MSNNLSNFIQFSKEDKKPNSLTKSSNVIAYSRVSSKEQFLHNMSLDTQKKAIEEYAYKNKLTIVEHFGGTYESAQKDSEGRKEFKRMLDYIKKSKGKISQILVYSTDRFSRTGGAAIKLASDLREQYGVSIFAITQPVDTTNPNGIFNQDIQFLFSHYDNQLRKEKVISGMRNQFMRGVWCLKPPFGYDIVQVNGDRKIVVNEKGKKLRKAFQWKNEGMKNVEIITRLKAFGIDFSEQKMSKTFANPFYCGVIVTKMLDNPVNGVHEPLVSKEVFLRANGITSTGGRGINHTKENEFLPLKIFCICEKCGKPYSGYFSKKKQRHYYKCRTQGCKSNRFAGELNALFEAELQPYVIDPQLLEPLQHHLEYFYSNLEQESTIDIPYLKGKLTELQGKIEVIEEKYYVSNEMDRKTFEKFYSRFEIEKRNIEKEIEDSTQRSANFVKAIGQAVHIATNTLISWATSDVLHKEYLQKTLFPEGILYHRELDTVRPIRVNSVFTVMSLFKRLLEEGKKKIQYKNILDSLQVELEGVELPRVIA